MGQWKVYFIGRFSLWVWEVAGAIPGCPELVINQIICPNNSMFSGILRFFQKLIEKKSAKQIIKTNKWEHNCSQLFTAIIMGQWFSGMILALGAIAGWPKSRLFKNMSQQLHVLRNIAFFPKLIEQKKSAKKIIKTYKSEHYHYQLLTTFMGQCSSCTILAMGARAPISSPGCLQLGTIQIIGPNISMFSSKLHSLRNYSKNSLQNRL